MLVIWLTKVKIFTCLARQSFYKVSIELSRDQSWSSSPYPPARPSIIRSGPISRSAKTKPQTKWGVRKEEEAVEVEEERRNISLCVLNFKWHFNFVYSVQLFGKVFSVCCVVFFVVLLSFLRRQRGDEGVFSSYFWNKHKQRRARKTSSMRRRLEHVARRTAEQVASLPLAFGALSAAAHTQKIKLFRGTRTYIIYIYLFHL